MLQHGCGSQLNRRSYAGCGPCFHLPGFHFGTGFFSHSHVFSRCWPGLLAGVMHALDGCAPHQIAFDKQRDLDAQLHQPGQERGNDGPRQDRGKKHHKEEVQLQVLRANRAARMAHGGARHP